MTRLAGARALEQNIDRISRRIDEAEHRLVAQGRSVTPLAVARRAGVALRDVLLRHSDKPASTRFDSASAPEARAASVSHAAPAEFTEQAPVKAYVAPFAGDSTRARRLGGWTLLAVAAGTVGAGVALAVSLPLVAVASVAAGAALAYKPARAMANQRAIDSWARSHWHLASQDAALVHKDDTASWRTRRDTFIAEHPGALVTS